MATKAKVAPVEVREVVREIEVPRNEVWMVRDRGDQPPHGLFASEDAANAYVNSIVGRDGLVSGQFEVKLWPVAQEK